MHVCMHVCMQTVCIRICMNADMLTLPRTELGNLSSTDTTIESAPGAWYVFMYITAKNHGIFTFWKS